MSAELLLVKNSRDNWREFFYQIANSVGLFLPLTKGFGIMRRVYISSVFLFVLLSAALAQPVAGMLPLQPLGTPDADDAKVTINLSISFFVPASNEDQDKETQVKIRRMIYDLAGHECAVLRDVIASDCKLEDVRVYAQRRSSIRDQQQPEGFNINGTVGFRIVPKQ